MKQRQHKKLIWRKTDVTLVVLFLAVLSGIWGLTEVYASLTASDEVSNSLQLGKERGTIIEDFTPPTSSKPIKPGDVYPKKVTVKNSENVGLFVRVSVVPEIQSSDGVLLPSSLEKELQVDIGADWVLGEDGYYYYTKDLGPSEETTPLFTTVTLASSLGDKYTDATFTLNIKSETIVSMGNHYRDAFWQGSTPSDIKLSFVDGKYQAIVVGKGGEG